MYEFEKFENIEVDYPIAFFDLETTGFLHRNARIVEWSILRIDPGRSPVLITKRCNPGCPISSGASQVHGIYNKDVENEPHFDDHANQVLDLLAGCVVSGYNIIKFDVPFLNNVLKSIDIFYPEFKPLMYIDVMDFFHKVHADRSRKWSLSLAFEIYCKQNHDNAHGSKYDVIASAKVLDRMVLSHKFPNRVSSLSLSFNL